MSYKAQEDKRSTAGAPLLLEPVPIFREEVRWGCPWEGCDAVYTARVLLNINPDDAELDFAKPPIGKTQIEKENQVKVFPNPAKNMLNIQFEETISTDGRIQIYNNMGSLVLCAEINKGNAAKTIDVSQLQSGLYFYSIILSGEKISSGKLTILNK